MEWAAGVDTAGGDSGVKGVGGKGVREEQVVGGMETELGRG